MTGKRSLQYWTFAGASGRAQCGLRYGRLNTGGAAWAAVGGLAKVWGKVVPVLIEGRRDNRKKSLA